MLWNDSDKATKSTVSAQKASSCLKTSSHKHQLVMQLHKTITHVIYIQIFGSQLEVIHDFKTIQKISWFFHLQHTVTVTVMIYYKSYPGQSGLTAVIPLHITFQDWGGK